MLGSSTLEVALTLAAIYLVFSMITSTVVEWIARSGTWRGKLLKRGLGTALEQQQDGPFLTSLYGHPVIGALNTEGASPAYISSRTFALAILDLAMELVPPTPLVTGQTQVRANIRDMGEPLIPIAPSTQRLLQAITFGTDGSIGHVQDRIEKWYDELMMRITGVYTRKAKAWTLSIAIVIAAVLNVDTVMLVKYLNGHEMERQQFSAAVQSQLTPEMNPEQKLSTIIAFALQTPLPVGWCLPGRRDSSKQGGWALLTKIAGLAITAIAISFGAPFWFDMLGKIINMRQVGAKPASTVAAQT